MSEKVHTTVYSHNGMLNDNRHIGYVVHAIFDGAPEPYSLKKKAAFPISHRHSVDGYQ